VSYFFLAQFQHPFAGFAAHDLRHYSFFDRYGLAGAVISGDRERCQRLSEVCISEEGHSFDDCIRLILIVPLSMLSLIQSFEELKLMFLIPWRSIRFPLLQRAIALRTVFGYFYCTSLMKTCATGD
jgi:hypothetical protein